MTLLRKFIAICMESSYTLKIVQKSYTNQNGMQNASIGYDGEINHSKVLTEFIHLLNNLTDSEFHFSVPSKEPVQRSSSSFCSIFTTLQ